MPIQDGHEKPEERKVNVIGGHPGKKLNEDTKIVGGRAKRDPEILSKNKRDQ